MIQQEKLAIEKIQREFRYRILNRDITITMYIQKNRGKHGKLQKKLKSTRCESIGYSTD